MAIPECLTCQIVRQDRLMYEGPAAAVVLATYEGELGVWPGPAPEIVAMGDGVLRIHRTEADGGATQRIVVRGGYAEVTPGLVIVLADHACDVEDIDPERARTSRERTVALRDALPAGDHGRAYYEDKIAWCDLLLAHAGDAEARAPERG